MTKINSQRFSPILQKLLHKPIIIPALTILRQSNNDESAAKSYSRSAIVVITALRQLTFRNSRYRSH